MGGEATEVEPRRGLRRRVVDLTTALVTVVLALMLLVATSISLSIARPGPLLAAQSIAPLGVFVALAIGLVSLILRRSMFVVGSIVVGAFLLGLCLPMAVARDPARWVARAPTIRVYSGNIRFDNDRNDEAVRAIMSVDADVVVLNEVTEHQLGLLRSAGAFRRWPTYDYWDGPFQFGDLIMTNVPDSEVDRVVFSNSVVPMVRVPVGRTRVQVWAVHPDAPPPAAWDTSEWQAGIDELRVAARRGARSGPIVLTGDFNASAWHDPFRRLLDAGFHDAHDDLGQGWSRSWGPVEMRGVGGPLIRIDHCVYSGDVMATRIVDLELPGSDHRPFVATLAVEQR